MTLQPEDSRRNRDPQFPPVEETEAFDPIAYASFGRREDQPLIRNPYVLAGLAVAGAIVLAVIVVVLSGGGGGSAGSRDGGDGNGNRGVAVDALTPRAGGVTARSIAAATVREGPSTDFKEIAPLRTGQDVEVTGKNANSSWFQIIYPPGSALKGWVPGSALKLPDGASETLAVVAATPITRPTVALPTTTPEAEATAAPTATPVPTQAPGPDLALAIGNSVCQPGTQLIVTVRNTGTSPVTNRQVRITVASASGVLGVADSLISLEPNASVNLSTNQIIVAPRMLARIDLLGSPPDINPANNAAECVAGAGPAPTPGPGGGLVTPNPPR